MCDAFDKLNSKSYTFYMTLWSRLSSLSRGESRRLRVTITFLAPFFHHTSHYKASVHNCKFLNKFSKTVVMMLCKLTSTVICFFSSILHLNLVDKLLVLVHWFLTYFQKFDWINLSYLLIMFFNSASISFLDCIDNALWSSSWHMKSNITWRLLFKSEHKVKQFITSLFYNNYVNCSKRSC